jgi:adenylylsulfate kinase
MKETHLRSVVKSATYRVFGTFVTASIVWLITGQLKLALGIGLADTTAKLFAYYLHERLWHKIQFGIVHPPKPEIMHGDGI